MVFYANILSFLEERLEAEYLDIADKAASELLLEVCQCHYCIFTLRLRYVFGFVFYYFLLFQKLHIANIEISRSYEEQALMTGGWM